MRLRFTTFPSKVDCKIFKFYFRPKKLCKSLQKWNVLKTFAFSKLWNLNSQIIFVLQYFYCLLKWGITQADYSNPICSCKFETVTEQSWIGIYFMQVSLWFFSFFFFFFLMITETCYLRMHPGNYVLHISVILFILCNLLCIWFFCYTNCYFVVSWMWIKFARYGPKQKKKCFAHMT